MQSFFKKESLWVFVFAFVLCIAFSGSYPIYILDESRNAAAAFEMLVRNDWIVPTFNNQLRTDKPPLHYFFMMLGYKLFGLNALGARFFSGLFGALLFLVTFQNVKKHLGSTVSLITVLVLGASVFFVQEFHLAVPDPYLIFFMVTGLFCLFNQYKTPNAKWFLSAYLSLGLGVLAKGPIAILLPGLIVLIFLLLNRSFNLRMIKRLNPFVGLFIVFLVAGPWYVLVHNATEGAWTQGFFFDHNMSRFSSEKEGHGGLFLLTFAYVLLGLLPFSVFFIQAMVQGWKSRKTNDFIFFSVVAVAATLVFFSVASTKLPNYPMPCYPFLAILIAFYLNRIRQGHSAKSTYWSIGFLLLVSLALPIGGYFALANEASLSEHRYLALWLTITFVVGVCSLILYQKKESKAAFVTLSLGWMVLGIGLFGFVYPRLTSSSPVSVARNLIQEDAHVVVYKRFDSAFVINFQRTYPVLQTHQELQDFLETHPTALVLTNTRHPDDLKVLEDLILLLEQKALFENHVTRIYKK
ncbi:MAG: glycosyltransferase family 39 protein [Bacteroidota bacterium]